MSGIRPVRPGELESRSRHLSPERFVELYRLYEQLRQKTDVEPELRILRERLVHLRPSRPLTFARLLCQPFETFLVDTARDGTMAGLALARRHCRAIARLVRARMAPSQRRQIDEKLRVADPDDPAAGLAAGKLLWPAAAAILRDARLRMPRGAADPRRQVDMLAGCLEIGAAMTALSRGLPTGRISGIDRSAGTLFAQLARGLSDEKFGHARYLLALLLQRLQNPAGLLDMLADRRLDLSGPRRQALIRMAGTELQRQATDAGRAAIRAAGDDSVRVDALIRRLAGAVDVLSASGVDATTEIPALAASAHDLMQRLHEDIAQAPAARPDVRGLPAEYTAGLALAGTYAGLEREAAAVNDLDRGFARLGVGGLFDDDRARLRRSVSGRLERFMARAPAGSGTAAASVAGARAELFGLVYLVEMLDGPAEADRVRRKGLALIGAV